MKTKLYIILFLIAALSVNLIAQNDLELGKRYIKLGGSFRESGEFNLSKDYLDKGLAIVTKYKAEYWKAVGNEYLGYYWRDRAAIENNDALYDKALSHLNTALNIYKNVIKNDPSSVNAVQLAIDGLRQSKPVPQGNDVMSLIQEGLENLYNQDIDAAKDAFEEALEIEPDNQLAQQLLDLCDNIESSGKTGSALNNSNSGRIRVITSLKELEEARKKDVEIIDFSNTEFTNIPDEVFACRNLRVLNLANNEISSISEDDICKLKNLQILDLTNNNLTELPECIKRMKKLQVLYLRGNDVPFSQILRFKDELPNLQIIMDEEE